MVVRQSVEIFATYPTVKLADSMGHASDSAQKFDSPTVPTVDSHIDSRIRSLA